jgi:two-component system response regulator PilR (NtrC family)
VERLSAGSGGAPAGAGARLPEAGIDLEAHVASIERALIAQALERAGGVKTRAAELLGMSFRSFRYYAKKYQLG